MSRGAAAPRPRRDTCGHCRPLPAHSSLVECNGGHGAGGGNPEGGALKPAPRVRGALWALGPHMSRLVHGSLPGDEGTASKPAVEPDKRTGRGASMEHLGLPPTSAAVAGGSGQPPDSGVGSDSGAGFGASFGAGLVKIVGKRRGFTDLMRLGAPPRMKMAARPPSIFMGDHEALGLTVRHRAVVEGPLAGIGERAHKADDHLVGGAVAPARTGTHASAFQRHAPGVGGRPPGGDERRRRAHRRRSSSPAHVPATFILAGTCSSDVHPRRNMFQRRSSSPRHVPATFILAEARSLPRCPGWCLAPSRHGR